MQILTPEAARAEIINKDFTSLETVLPLPSFDQSVQHLPQHSLENTSSENRLCLRSDGFVTVNWRQTAAIDLSACWLDSVDFSSICSLVNQHKGIKFNFLFRTYVLFGRMFNLRGSRPWNKCPKASVYMSVVATSDVGMSCCSYF